MEILLASLSSRRRPNVEACLLLDDSKRNKIQVIFNPESMRALTNATQTSGYGHAFSPIMFRIVDSTRIMVILSRWKRTHIGYISLIYIMTCDEH